MRKHSKKLLSFLLAVIMTVSVFSVFSAHAAEKNQTDGAVYAQDDLAQIAATEESVDPSEDPTEEPSEEPSEEPTEEPEPPVVGKVRNLERNSFESDRCQLDWDPVEGADGYYVYYLNADLHKNFSKVADVKTNTCTVRNLRQGTQYHFKVSAYVEFNGEIIEGEQTLKKTATQPAQVTGLTKWRSSDVLEFEWNRNANATGYRIYRTEQGGREVLYRTIRGNSNTEFTDTSVREGRRYTYRVKSFRETLNTSYSSDAGVITFIAGLCGPDYDIVSRCKRVNLTWNRNPYATHYEVYYSTSPDNGSFVKLFTTPRLYFNTTRLTVGRRYYFRVRPIYVSGSTTITGTSNKKSATVLNSAYGRSIGSSYIEVSIDQQYLWAFKDGREIASTDVVTGTLGVYDTPKGYYSIKSKTRDTYLSGPGYSSHVDFWMPFIGGYGIHDSSWRSSYGNPIYKTSGSHGCVNTPRSSVVSIYNNLPTGTPVIIY